MRKVLLIIFAVAAGLYLLLCGLLYFRQESLLFYPQRLPASYRFDFAGSYAEELIAAADGTRLSGLLFRADAGPAGLPKGLVFFLHGNGGSLAGWGSIAPLYTRLGYDVFMLDYRGYGKSGGRIQSQAQLFSDVEAAYQHVAPRYGAGHGRLVVAGYSLGTGPAAWLAGRHRPDLLLLHAPYYSMGDMAAQTLTVWPALPSWLLRYPLPTYELVQQVAAPIVLVHGDQDALIPYESSLRLKKLLKADDQLITIKGGSHNGLLDQPQYRQAIQKILE